MRKDDSYFTQIMTIKEYTAKKIIFLDFSRASSQISRANDKSQKSRVRTWKSHVRIAEVLPQVLDVVTYLW